MWERTNSWTQRAIFGDGTKAPLGFYPEHWKPYEEDPDYAELERRYGDGATTEVAMLRAHLLREVVYAACGFEYTLQRLEQLLGEVRKSVEEPVERPGPRPEPELGHGVGNPKLAYASFEFMNLIGWLRTIDERLDRAYAYPGDPRRAGLLPSLAEDRPIRPRVDALVRDFRDRSVERPLAEYVLHAEAVPAPFGGGQLADDTALTISVPDRPAQRVGTRHDLTYEEGQDALSLAREADGAVEALVEGLIDAFIDEGRAIDAERGED